jgi:exosome complex RNA-binding protein Rrp42 (RNase PH superfamily)
MNVANKSISKSEQQYILEGCRANCREDGRSRDEFRSYYCVVDDFALSYGSARVFLPTRETHLLVSVKAELVVPASIAPDEGVVEVHVDFMHSQGGNNRQDDELESTLSSLLVPHLVDTKELCIAPENYVWKINIDIFVIASAGGSLMDACSQGIRSALQKTLLPRLAVVPAEPGSGDNKPTIQVDSDIKVAKPIVGVDNIPVIVTVSLLMYGKKPVMIVDATADEETCAFAQVHAVLDQGDELASRDPMICALHKAGGGAMPFTLLQEVTSFCLEASTSSTVVVAESMHHLLQDNFVIQQ